MLSLRRIRPAPPLGRRFALIVALLVCIFGCLVLLVARQMEVLSGVRAYVGGEGAWSKSQKDAVHHLRRYARSGSAADYDRFLRAIAVPLGGRAARLELEKPAPDMARVYAGFIRGRIHPDDVPLLVMLFRRFGRAGYMADAIAVWTEVDRSILRLRRLGELLRGALESPAVSTRRVEPLLERVERINARLTPLADRFSAVLGAGARRVEGMLLLVISAAAVLLLSCGALFSFLVLRRVRESEERYRQLVENANDLVFTHDLHGNITEVNAACEHVTGYARDEACRMNIADIVAPEHLGRARRMIARRVAHVGPAVYELDILTRDGRRVPLEVSTRVVLVRGRPAAVQGIARVISERRHAEEANARLLADLTRASRLKSEFVSTISHELRTPLNVILGYLEMARDTDAPLARAECIERVEAAARDLLELIEETLEMGRIDAQRDEPRLQSLDLPALWADLASRNARLPRRPGVRLEWSQDVPAAVVVTDPRKLSVIVRNLVGNALKFTEAGWVRVTAALTAQELVVRVADSGIGIPAADQASIFDMFRQAGGSDGRRFGGSGLGLYIVRRFVEQLEGTIAVESAPGEGAVFTVRLPRRTASAPPCAA